MQDRYRTEATTQLAFFSMGSGDGELLIYDTSEEVLASRLSRGFTTAALVAGAGIIAALEGLARSFL